MTYGDMEDPQGEIARNLKDLRERGYRIFKLPEWENSRAEIVYATKN